MKEEVNFKVRFFARKSRGRKTGNYLLLVRVTVNSKRVEISLKKEVPIDLWDEKMQCLKGRSQSASRFNSYLDKIKMRFNLIEQQLLFENKKPTAELVKARYNGDPDPDEETIPTLLELYDEHNRRFKELIGTRNHSESTYKRHLTSRSHTCDFIFEVYGKVDLPFEKVNYKFLGDYEHYLKAVRKCNHNSTMKYIKNLGKIINQAYGEGYIERNPFDKFKLSFENVERERLSQVEIDRMVEMDIPEKRLDRVRDLFVFCIFTGIAYGDVKALRMQHLHIDEDGTKWVKNKRLKTSVEFLVPILPIAQKVIDKYADHPQRLEFGQVIPEISNQNYNGYLKEVAIRCAIDKNLTSHMARHTFATTIALDNGVPLEVLSKMLGHTDTKTTQIYAKMQEKGIKRGMANLLNQNKKKNN